MNAKHIKTSLIGVFVLALFSAAMHIAHKDRYNKTWGDNSVSRILNRLEWSWYDAKFKLKTDTPKLFPKSHAQGVLVAKIDDASLARYGRWPWNRGLYSKILDTLYGIGAEVVGFDAIFSEPEFQREYIKDNLTMPIQEGAKPLAEELELKSEMVEGLSTSFPNVGDLLFGSGVFRNPKTVLGYIWQDPVDCPVYDPADDKKRDKPWTVDQARLNGMTHVESLIDNLTSLQGLGISVSGTPPLKPSMKTSFPLHPCAIANRSALSAKAKYQGFFNAVADDDGLFRRAPLVFAFSPEYIPVGSRDFLPKEWFESATFFPSLALQSLVAHWNPASEAGKVKAKVELREGGTEIAAVLIPRQGQEDLRIDTLADGTMPLNFYGSQEGERHGNERFLDTPIGEFSLASLPMTQSDADEKNNELTDSNFAERYKLDPDTHQPLKGKIVIIGPTALGVYDLRPNPVQGNAAGVFLHATAIGRILQQAEDPSSRLAPTCAPEWVSQLILWVLGILMALVFAKSQAVTGATTALFVQASFTATDVGLFGYKLIVLDATTISVALAVVAVSILTYKYFTEERERAFVKGAFEKYVSPDLVGEIMKDPKKLSLGGQKKELTVLFSDIRGFTTISESMGAAELAKFMNEYLSPMTDIVQENRGTIDKYMGDAIMAIFGAPIEYPNHAEKAVDAALGMMNRLAELQVDWKARNLKVDIGIGMNTGEMSVGNMGSSRIFSYTVMGDAVNLGSRIEGINKEYKTNIIVSEFTRKYLGPEYVLRELDRVKVKGKLLPVTIFEVMGKGALPEKALLAQRFEAALSLYYKGLFVEALVLFKGLAEQDPTSEIYVERCESWMAEPPEAGWDGSWTMKSK